MTKITIAYHIPTRENEQRYELALEGSHTYARNFLELVFFLQASLKGKDSYDLKLRKSAHDALGDMGTSVLERIVGQHNTFLEIRNLTER